ncbi:unnamed protein product [Rangifer tarandus platyrhynchus]|uniref:Uncharacterized protein n=2 Tax=Rangifer tarandus platyrhynchus TaxID=3082113 RepID=A0ABN8ZUU1_RANTA|nr:unnamed protein product [Rangifer tarandus platyrhynchus]CAI9711728.1 unnamed protein product [Rangifer tarandus platyrhynchus]
MTPDPHAHSWPRPGGRTARLTSALSRRWGRAGSPGRLQVRAVACGSELGARAPGAGWSPPSRTAPPLGRGLWGGASGPARRGQKGFWEGPANGLSPQKGAPRRPVSRHRPPQIRTPRRTPSPSPLDWAWPAREPRSAYLDRLSPLAQVLPHASQVQD